MTRRALVIGLVVLAALQPSVTSAATLTTPQILASTSSAALSCMRWMPIGICLWLRCSFTGCRVRTSVKIGHYNPDLVVSVYNELGGNPWAEIRATLGLAQQRAAAGVLGILLSAPIGSSGGRTEGGAEHKNLVFREADAIGHPLGTLSGVAGLAGLVCPSQAIPFVPYFQSGLDALSWRLDLPEIVYPASWVPGLREIGTWPLWTWGSVFPRTGWAVQSDEAKAAAVIAERAGDIVTRTGQPHVYVPLTGTPSLGQRVWPPGALQEGDRRSGAWQMLAPQVESTCGVFGTNDLAGASSWGGGRVDGGGDYAWNLWRPYRCCARRGQLFLLDVDWTRYPP